MSLFDKLFRKNPFKGLSAKASEQNNDSIDQAHAVVADQYIALWELQKQRQQLEVKITGTSRTYQSMILAIDIERGLLWLDDLFPQQLILDIGDEITIRHHRNGEQLVIRAPILALGSAYDASGLAIALPDSAYYQPRRSAPRFSIGHQSPLSVKIRTLGQEPCYGALQDISTGGLRLLVAGNLMPHLRHGALLPLCEVNVSDELQIRCKARICAFRMGRNPYRHTQVSVSFIDLDEDTQNSLSLFLQASHNGQSSQSLEAYAA